MDLWGRNVRRANAELRARVGEHERLFLKRDVKVVQTVYPAHLRYFTLLGFVTGDEGTSWRVLVYGTCPVTRAFLGAALWRKSRG